MEDEPVLTCREVKIRASDPANSRKTEMADSWPVCPLRKLVAAWISWNGQSQSQSDISSNIAIDPGSLLTHRIGLINKTGLISTTVMHVRLASGEIWSRDIDSDAAQDYGSLT